MDQEILLEVVDLVEEHREVLNHLLGVQVVAVVTAAALLGQELLGKVLMVVLVYGHGIQVVVEVLAKLAAITQQRVVTEYQIV